MKTKLYDLVKSILQEDIRYRNSDKYLIWKVWEKQGIVNNDVLSKRDFIVATNPESITRARRKVQENNNGLQASVKILKSRQLKESKKGYFVYHNTIY